MECKLCELFQKATHPCVGGEGDRKAKVLFIQDTLGELDDLSNRPFVTKPSIALKKSLELRGITSTFFTSLVKCYSEKDISKSCVRSCENYLIEEVKEIDPEIIVPMGNESLKFCTGRVGLMKVRGSAQEVELLGRKRIILPTVNPNNVPKKPLYKSYLLKDLDTLKDLYENGMTQITGVTYKSLETVEDVISELRRMQSSNRIVFDIETTGKSPYGDYSKIVCISLTDKSHYGVVIPLYHRDTPFSTSELEVIAGELKILLESPIPKSAHNGKFDIEWLRVKMGINVNNFDFDTLLGHYLAVSEEQGTQGLKSQAWEFTDMGGYDNELDEYVKGLTDGEGVESRYNYDRVPYSILKTYAIADVDCCFRLVEIYKPMIDGNAMWKQLMKEILMPASYTLSVIEENGMKLDMNLANEYIQEYENEIKRITDRLYQFPEVLQIEKEKLALFTQVTALKKIPVKERTEEEKQKIKEYNKYKDYRFNFNSFSQLRELLFDKLGLVTTVTTDKGELSTNEVAMNELKTQHEIPKLLLELRKVNTLNNMFITKLPTMRDAQDILHSSFSLSGTVTGRTSSENPNFQQLPRKADENPLLFQYHHEPKSLFVSRFGDKGVIMNADYSALEMRISAIISGDKKMTQAFLSGVDIHKSNASYMWRIPIEEVTKDLRTKAKSLGFGIVYGKSGVSFAKDLFYDPSGTDPNKTSDWEKAKADGFDLIDHFLGTFSGLKRWLERTKKFAYKHGYVETMFGRRRRLPDLQSKVNSLKADAERQAINAPIQGTGSDLTLLSLIHINNYMAQHKMKSVIIATVHDSIVFDVYIPELPELACTIKSIMEHVHEPYFDTPVPILTELELGKNYGSTYEIELEDCVNIKSAKAAQEWIHLRDLKKYRKEIEFFKKRGQGYQEVIGYLHSHQRPLKELFTTLVEVYSEEGEK